MRLDPQAGAIASNSAADSISASPPVAVPAKARVQDRLLPMVGDPLGAGAGIAQTTMPRLDPPQAAAKKSASTSSSSSSSSHEAVPRVRMAPPLAPNLVSPTVAAVQSPSELAVPRHPGANATVSHGVPTGTVPTTHMSLEEAIHGRQVIEFAELVRTFQSVPVLREYGVDVEAFAELLTHYQGGLDEAERKFTE